MRVLEQLNFLSRWFDCRRENIQTSAKRDIWLIAEYISGMLSDVLIIDSLVIIFRYSFIQEPQLTWRLYRINAAVGFSVIRGIT